MDYISGRILTEQGFSKGYLYVNQNEIVEIEKGNPPKNPICKGIITPSLYNMHTHIGDTFIRFQDVPLSHDIVKLVAPPNGLKHRLLLSAKQKDIIQGMKQAIQEMKSNGINNFCDFRENGIEGVKIIRKAISNTYMEACILSRPKTLEYDKNEITSLLSQSDGIAISSMEEWEYNDLVSIVEQVKKTHKFFSLHVSERIREDVKKVVSLEPDFIIHMTKATKSDLQLIKNHHIPIVICPRSSYFFQNQVPLKAIKETGNTMLIGTDNGMLHSLNILKEIQFIQYHYPSLFKTEELLKAIIYAPRKVLNSKDVIQAANFPASYLVLDYRNLNLIYDVLHMRE